MLGLQIWISTVFRVARQFLTSTCVALGEVNEDHRVKRRRYFYPRKNRKLVGRILFDLKFWRRFVLSAQKTSFDFLLARLPRNDSRLYSDASSLFGMGGILIFGASDSRVYHVDGLF